MKTSSVRLRLVFVMLAWLAQALMPVVHATAMAESRPGGQAWCGDAASAAAALALLPPEVQAALNDTGLNAAHLADCTLVCAAGIATPPPLHVSPVAVLRAAGLEPAPSPLSAPAARPQAPTPPAHAPPAHG